MVRKLHNLASASSEKKGIGLITQTEVSMTTFGFAGFALNRPQIFGISRKNQAQREGFLHLWAVLNYMLGVRDEFNICLLPIEAAEIEFDVIMRNILAPYLQVETELFKQMLSALIDGMRPYMPATEYESQMFLTRRAVGIPGYQYDVKLKNEMPHRNIFTPEDLQLINVPLFKSPNILLLKVKDKSELTNSVYESKFLDYEDVFRKEFELPDSVMVKVKEVPRNETEFMASLNAKQYNKLSRTAKIYVGMNLSMVSGLNNRVSKYMVEQFLSFILSSMKNQQRNRKDKK